MGSTSDFSWQRPFFCYFTLQCFHTNTFTLTYQVWAGYCEDTWPDIKLIRLDVILGKAIQKSYQVNTAGKGKMEIHLYLHDIHSVL